MRNKQAYKTQTYKQYKSAEKGWQSWSLPSELCRPTDFDEIWWKLEHGRNEWLLEAI